VRGMNLAAMQQEYTEMIETASSLSHAGYYLQNNIIIFDRMQPQSFARLLSRNAITKGGKTKNHSA